MGSLGVTLLLFFVGMEVSSHKLVQGWRVAIFGTLLQILISIGMVWVIGWMVHWSLARIVAYQTTIAIISISLILSAPWIALVRRRLEPGRQPPDGTPWRP